MFVKLASNIPGRTSKCGTSAVANRFHALSFSTMDSQIPANVELDFSSVHRSDQTLGVSHVIWGGRGESSPIPGPTIKVFNSAVDTTPAVRAMLVAIMKENNSLSFSNKPRQTFT